MENQPFLSIYTIRHQVLAYSFMSFWHLYILSFPDDESNDAYRSSAPQKLPRKNLGFDAKGTESRVMNQTSKKKSRHKSRRSKERQSKLSSTQTKDAISVENGSVDDSCWPHFSDEDYIVFCFREDGAFDVVKDGKPETSNRFDCMSRSSRTVNRKVSQSAVFLLYL